MCNLETDVICKLKAVIHSPDFEERAINGYHHFCIVVTENPVTKWRSTCEARASDVAVTFYEVLIKCSTGASRRGKCWTSAGQVQDKCMTRSPQGQHGQVRTTGKLDNRLWATFGQVYAVCVRRTV